jgi:hypothetical protein
VRRVQARLSYLVENAALQDLSTQVKRTSERSLQMKKIIGQSGKLLSYVEGTNSHRKRKKTSRHLHSSSSHFRYSDRYPSVEFSPLLDQTWS